MPLSKLRDFLDSNQVKYLVISHSLAYTAQGIAALTHIKGKELAKTVMVMVDGRLAMAVVPASFRVDLHRLKKYLGAETVELASEHEFRDRFPDCETGSMPPFGNLYGMDVFADETLAGGQGNRLQRGHTPGAGSHELRRLPAPGQTHADDPGGKIGSARRLKSAASDGGARTSAVPATRRPDTSARDRARRCGGSTCIPPKKG